MHFLWIKQSITQLTIMNAQFRSMSPSQSPAPSKLPIKLSVYPTSLREAAITVIKENSLSPGRVATLSTDLKVELAYELSLISDAPLTARFRVEHWLLNPLEAEAAGNDWRVEEDCDLLTLQIIDAWSSLPNGATINYCSMSDYQSQRHSQRNNYLRTLLDESETAIYGAPPELELLSPTVVELATPLRSTKQRSPLLTYILSHNDLAPALLGCLQQWPTLLSHSTLHHCDNLHSICTFVQLAHKSWTSELRSSRLLLWLHLAPPAARGELTPLIIDDCRTSMIIMTIQTARQLSKDYASVCKLAANAIKTSLENSPDRSRVMQMCKVGDNLSPILLDKLLNIRSTCLLHTWSRATVAHTAMLRHGFQLFNTVTKCKAAITAHKTKRHITSWLTQMHDSYNTASTDSCSDTNYNSSATADKCDYAKPSVTYLAEERQALRTFFKNQIGEPHIHVYLASDSVSNLPRGTFNPCDKKHRKPDFPLRIPVKQKVGPDVAIGQLSKLLPDRPELTHVQICTRSPMAAQLARSVIKSTTIQRQTVIKQGGWDDVPPSSILFNPIHPTIKNKRPKLEGKPTPEELAAEKEFEAACLSASLGGASEKRYTYYMQQFNEHLTRCEATLLIESNTAADNTATLKDLRFWIRRFLLNEGGVRGLQYSTISGKAYAIRWHYLTTYGIDALADWVEHKLFMKGLKRVRHSPKRKIPVSWALLMYITRQLRAEGSWRSRTILAAILVGWWYLCRISELIAFRIGSVRFYDASGSQLSNNSDRLESAVEVDLIFGVTKNDVEGDGAIRTHNKVDSVLCVVSALAELMSYRRQCAADKSTSLDPMSPLFKFVDDSQDSTTEKQLSRSTVTRVLKAAASSAGIPDSKVSCHSLRSGGAVQMMSVSGCSYSDVRLFGRWRSDAARIYLRAVRGMMLAISARMAANSTDCSVMLTGGAREKRY